MTTRPRLAQQVLQAARTAVDAHWARRWARGHLPVEVELTGVLLAACDVAGAHYVQFTPAQEGHLGSDWLWWFVEESGECFGLLVQAKRLERTPAGWHIGLDYRTAAGDRQIDLLLNAADALEVPAAYVLYGGSAEYRRDLPCRDGHTTDCDRCLRSGVTLLDALIAEYELRWDDPAVRAFAKSMPLEDVAAGPSGRSIWFGGLKTLTPDLAAFLTTSQFGARGIARRIVESVAAVRQGQFSATLLERTVTTSDAVFSAVPRDQGHLARPYLQFALRGLRREPPPLVELALRGDLVDPPHPTLAGVVIVPV